MTTEPYSWSFVTQIFHSGQPIHDGDRKTILLFNKLRLLSLALELIQHITFMNQFNDCIILYDTIKDCSFRHLQTTNLLPLQEMNNLLEHIVLRIHILM